MVGCGWCNLCTGFATLMSFLYTSNCITLLKILQTSFEGSFSSRFKFSDHFYLYFFFNFLPIFAQYKADKKQSEIFFSFYLQTTIVAENEQKPTDFRLHLNDICMFWINAHWFINCEIIVICRFQLNAVNFFWLQTFIVLIYYVYMTKKTNRERKTA